MQVFRHNSTKLKQYEQTLTKHFSDQNSLDHNSYMALCQGHGRVESTRSKKFHIFAKKPLEELLYYAKDRGHILLAHGNACRFTSLVESHRRKF